MKRTILIIITLALSHVCLSQIDERDYSEDNGGFGAIMMSFRTLDGNIAIFSGGGGGFMINDFRLGVFFNGLTNSFSKNDTTNISYKLGCSYGGLWLGYPFLKEKQWHLIADLKLSIGSTRLINTSWQQIDNGMFIGVSPSFGIEYSVNEILMLCAGIEYHYSFFTTPPIYYTPESFSSPGIYISLKLGSF